MIGDILGQVWFCCSHDWWNHHLIWYEWSIWLSRKIFFCGNIGEFTRIAYGCNPLAMIMYQCAIDVLLHCVSFLCFLFSLQVLYLKNLNSKATLEDLFSLFVSFQQKDGPQLLFRLLTGRMKGQAFITFPSMCSAEGRSF